MAATETITGRTELAAILVRLARELGVEAEQMRAGELLREAKSTWPGTEEERWAKWLAEAGASIGLRSKSVELSIDEALQLSQDGALLVTRGPAGETLVCVGFNGRQVWLADGSLDRKTACTPQELRERLNRSTGQRATWLRVDTPDLPDIASRGQEVIQPLQRLMRILRPESSDILMVVLFAFFVGVLSLATPLAVEALVNTVAFGRFLQPVIVLSVLLFAFLAFGAAILALQTFVVEIIQRRLFARVAADLAFRLPRVREEAFDLRNGPELVNRFFDVVTLQKVCAHLLLDGIAIVLATIVGMAVLAFYHPWLLGFDVLLLAIVVAGLLLLGRGAISSGIEESKYKYRVAAWLEDLASCRRAFKLKGAADFAVDRANYLASQYLAARRSHFRILFRQIGFALALQAVAGTVLLGFGGWLVIQGQLTLGQLVAAELIVAAILGSLAKFGKHLEGFYDLTAAIDKLGQLFDLPLERQDGLLYSSQSRGARLRLTDVKLDRGSLSKAVSFEVHPGERVALVGPPTSGKSTILDLLYGARRPSSGHVEIDGIDPLDARPDVLRANVTLVRSAEVFEGTLAENVHLHRSDVGSAEVRVALEQVGLLEDALRLPNGLETPLASTGAPLSGTQMLLLMLARAFAGSPRLLLIDGTLDALPDDVIMEVAPAVFGDAEHTVIVASGRKQIVDLCDAAIRLSESSNGSISGSIIGRGHIS